MQPLTMLRCGLAGGTPKGALQGAGSWAAATAPRRRPLAQRCQASGKGRGKGQVPSNGKGKSQASSKNKGKSRSAEPEPEPEPEGYLTPPLIVSALACQEGFTLGEALSASIACPARSGVRCHGRRLAGRQAGWLAGS